MTLDVCYVRGHPNLRGPPIEHTLRKGRPLWQGISEVERSDPEQTPVRASRSKRANVPRRKRKPVGILEISAGQSAYRIE